MVVAGVNVKSCGVRVRDESRADPIFAMGVPGCGPAGLFVKRSTLKDEGGVKAVRACALKSGAPKAIFNLTTARVEAVPEVVKERLIGPPRPVLTGFELLTLPAVESKTVVPVVAKLGRESAKRNAETRKMRFKIAPCR